MPHLDVSRDLAEADVVSIVDWLQRTRARTGREPLSDHLWLDLVHGRGDRFVAVVARDRDGAIAGYAQASSAHDATLVGLVVDDPGGDAALGEALLRAVADAVASDDGGRIVWWVADPEPWQVTVAESVGLVADRRLFQMRRPLPTGVPITIATRAFRPGHDDAAWLEVNNRAFAGHGEQGGWDLDVLRRRIAEPWFDPAGFRLHERDGTLAGFCWTKIHADDPDRPDAPPGTVGEIYVVAVDPAFHGLGLGRQLTLAGLESLSDRGVTTGMLFVDAGNTAAVGLYRSLDFTVHRTDTAFAGDVGGDC